MIVDYSYIFDKVRDFYSYLSYNNPSGWALPPLRYTFDITYRCNLTCPYCYIGYNHDRKKDELTTQEWFNVIDQVPRFGIISWIGGEPLIREDFLEIYEKSSKRTPYRVNVYSNGTLLNEKIADSFIKNKLLCLSVSLDGYGKKHDENRKADGAFDTIINNLNMLNSKMKGKHNIILDIKTVLLENNIDDFIALYELCTKKNYDFFSISIKRTGDVRESPYLRTEWGEEFHTTKLPLELYFDMDKFKDVYKELQKLSKHSKTKLRWAPKLSPRHAIEEIEELFTRTDEPVSKIYKPCLYPFSNTYVNPEGHVYPCLSYDIGSAKEKPLQELINDAKYKDFRKKLKAEKAFPSCQLCCELYYNKLKK